jgi:hypothetical protein
MRYVLPEIFNRKEAREKERGEENGEWQGMRNGV